jgi:probable HAF family extracellular repeat protein
MRLRLTIIVVILLGAGLPPTVFGSTGPSFQGLGDLPGGGFSSFPIGISDGGSVVVGNSKSASGVEAFRWSANGGMVGLGTLPGDSYSQANATSADGSVVVGRSSSFGEAFRWTASDGMVSLGAQARAANGVSADGSVIVGTTGDNAFRWTQATGIVALRGLSSVGPLNQALATSGDGSVLVGRSKSSGASGGEEAFRWTASGMTGLGGYRSVARAVSADGSVVVGDGRGASGIEAFRWTASGGRINLGTLGTIPGHLFDSFALDISADGSVIVGRSDTDARGGTEAFLWNPADGMRLLQDILTADFGLDLTGWRLTSATGISADGLTIAGVGYSPNTSSGQEAFIAVIPEPSSTAILFVGAMVLLHFRKG